MSISVVGAVEGAKMAVSTRPIKELPSSCIPCPCHGTGRETDKLFETYDDPRLVLAEYNGGPVNARRLRNGSPRLAAETRDYVVEVMTVLDGIYERREIEISFERDLSRS